APENGLDTLDVPWEQAQLEFRIKIFGNHLRFLPNLENDGSAVANNRHTVITLFGKPPDERTVAVGDISAVEASSRELQNPALNDAERAPGKLNQLNHAIPGDFTTTRTVGGARGSDKAKGPGIGW